MEVAEEWEMGVETPGTGKGRGERANPEPAEGRDPGEGGQATNGKATGREEKWGKAKVGGGKGTDGSTEFGVRNRGREGGSGEAG